MGVERFATWSDCVKTLRADRTMTQAQFALLGGWARRTVINWEAATTEPDRTSQLALAAIDAGLAS